VKIYIDVKSIENKRRSMLFLYGIECMKFRISFPTNKGKKRKQSNMSISTGNKVKMPGIIFK